MSFFISTNALFGTAEPSRIERINRENERGNLATITRLVIKGLLEHSMKSLNRLVNADGTELCDFFIMLEKVLFHGLKTSDKKALISLTSPDADLWATLGRALVDPRNSENSISQAYRCVEQLEYLKTSISRVRALLRLSMMQKRLHDLFTDYTSSPVVREQYEDWALLRSPDAEPLVGQLIGLSVLTCTFTLDFGLLKDLNEQQQEMKTLLDQNHYLEERNRLLQDKVGELKKRIYEEENGSPLDAAAVSFQRLSQETARRQSEADSGKLWMAEKERLLGTIIEKEDAVRLAEQQKADLAKMNKELYEKLREAEDAEKKLENDFILLRTQHAQEKQSMMQAMETQHSSQEHDQKLLGEMHAIGDKYTNTLSHLEEKQKELRAVKEELRKTEQERHRLEQELKELPFLTKEIETLKEQLGAVEEKANSYETALMDLGCDLSSTKLKILELREEMLPMGGDWQKDAEVAGCTGCNVRFSLTRRKHHCRACGRIFCQACSSTRVRLLSSTNPVRVCHGCFHNLQTLHTQNPDGNTS
ncbi:unnamed protein product, partial [Mesorhabditis spiculigera]